MRVYVASSWRNGLQPNVVYALRNDGHEVYDFRHPSPSDNGFAWSDIDREWKQWSPESFREHLASHPLATIGFNKDFNAMKLADAFVLVMPCGRSAHLELGWAVGARKHTCILLQNGEPELMYRMVDRLALDVTEVSEWLHAVRRAK
jgi:hypothetical protein